MRVQNLDTLPGVWAKLAKSPSGDISWHSLVGHAADAGAVAEALLANPVLRVRLARLAGWDALDDVTVGKLCALIALHDLGKASRGFQRQVLNDKRPLLRGHCAIVLGVLDGRYRSTKIRARFLDAVGLQSLQNSLTGGQGDLLWDYLCAVMAHHGAPLREDAIAEAIHHGVDCWTGTPDDDPIENVRALVAKVNAWYPELSQPGSLPTTPAFLHAFAGLITLADWLASDERLFPMDNGESDNRIEWSRTKAHGIVASLGLTGRPLTKALQSTSLDFLELFGKPPRPAQHAIAEFDSVAPGSVVILEAETGSGKTETALRHFLGLQQAGKVDGMYFALPLRTAAVQIAERLRQDIKRIVPELAGRFPVVTAVPGYIHTSEAGSKSWSETHSIQSPAGVRESEHESDSTLESGEYLLPETPASPVDRGEGYETIRATWAADHPKRYLAATLAVGTIDQALLSVLRIRHSHLRASAHLRQLLVVDEVHASDVYMRELLKQLVRRHRKAGGHVLLMSATLGSSARTVLLDELPVTFDAAMAYAYPVISSTDRAAVALHANANGLAPKRVRVEAMTVYESPDPLITRISNAVTDGARVLVIRNRVADAIETQRALEAAAVPTLCVHGKPSLHHSRFSREDRERLDRAMLAALGNTSSAAVAVVATQTAEQSLDIDADLLVTDLAPADVLLQRIGRLHRHTRTNRPSAYVEPRLLLLTPSPTLFDEQVAQRRPKWRHGWGSVYPNLVILQATLDAIMEVGTIEVPGMNRTLVEKATHADWLMRVAQHRGDAWVTHLNQFRGKGLAERGVAHTAMLDWNTSFSEATFQDKDSERNITTRLGEDDRLALFDTTVPGMFGTLITQLRISAWMCKGLSSDASVTDVRLEDDRLYFSFGTIAFSYDRFGLHLADVTPTVASEREQAGVE